MPLYLGADGDALGGRRVTEELDTLRSGLAVRLACQPLGVLGAACIDCVSVGGGLVVRTRRLRARSALALSPAERERLLVVLNSERFADMVSAAICSMLLDEGCYLASVRTMWMYRVLAAEGRGLERRGRL